MYIAHPSGIILLVRLALHLSCHTFSYTEVRELQLLSKLSWGSVSVILDIQVSPNSLKLTELNILRLQLLQQVKWSKATEQVGVEGGGDQNKKVEL